MGKTRSIAAPIRMAARMDKRRRNSYTGTPIFRVVTLLRPLFVQWPTSFLLNDDDCGQLD